MMKTVFIIIVVAVKFLIKAVDSREFVLKLFPSHSQNVHLKDKQDHLGPYKYDFVRVVKADNKPLERSPNALSKQVFNKGKLQSKLPVFVYFSGKKNDRRSKKANKKHKIKFKKFINNKTYKKSNRARHIQTNTEDKKKSGNEIEKYPASFLKFEKIDSFKKNILGSSQSLLQPFNYESLETKIPKSSSKHDSNSDQTIIDNDTKQEENDALEIGDNNLIMKLLNISRKRKKRKLMNLIYNISNRRERLIDNDLESVADGNTDFDDILRLLRDQLRKYYINVYSDDPNNKQILILEKQNPKYKDVYDLHSGIVLSSDNKISENDDNTFQNQRKIDALDEDDYIVADNHYDNESQKDRTENMKYLENLEENRDEKNRNRNTKRNEYGSEKKLDKQLHDIADLLSQIIIMDSKAQGQTGNCFDNNNKDVSQNVEKTIHDLENMQLHSNNQQTSGDCSDETVNEDKICELCEAKKKSRKFNRENCAKEKESAKPKIDNGYDNFNEQNSNLQKFATNIAVAQLSDVIDAQNTYNDRMVQANRHISPQSTVNEYDNQPVHRDDKSLLNYDAYFDDDDYVDRNQEIRDTKNVRWSCRNDKNYDDTLDDDTENLDEENVKSKRSAQEFLDEINAKAEKANQIDVIAQWQYETNITEETHAKAIASAERISEVEMSIWKQIKQFLRENSDYLGNYPQISRQLKLWSVLGEMALPKSKYVKLQESVASMTTIYSTTTVCEFQDSSNCGVPLEPDLENIMAHSRDPDELLHYWISWHSKTGQPMKKTFNTYVDLLNEAAALNNFSNAAAMWLDVYEDPEIEEKAAELWFEIQPLYLQLHAYVRRKLTEFYGTTFVHKNGVIPAHLLGNMWAQTWINIYDITKPFPNKTEDDVTAAFMEKFSSPKCMFVEADNFFQSLGFNPLPSLFWKNSVIDPPPKGVQMVCHGSAWDMHDREDFRIKMCTHIRMEDFVTIHHEMGHIQYYIAYKNQPFTFREGANPGFHEAIGDVIALSVMTPSHLKKIGLLKQDKMTHDDAEAEINFLYQMALEKITFLPFAYALDLWRWDVFRKKIHPNYYNKHFWNLRELYQGVQAPVHRTKEYFDPGAKYHIAANVPYFRYFLSFIMQFQFHKALCKEAKKYKPHNPTKSLHSCDIYKNKEAGKLLRKMLSLGSSQPWPQAMKVMTGNDEIDSKPLLEYFKPLQDWLEDENSLRSEKVGWSRMKTRKKKYSFQKI